MSAGYVPPDIIDFGVHVSLQIQLLKKRKKKRKKIANMHKAKINDMKPEATFISNWFLQSQGF